MIRRTALAAINHLLADETWARDRLRPFAGRVLRIDVPPLARHDFEILPEGTLGPTSEGVEPALVVTLPAAAVPRVAATRAALADAVRIEGDGEMAQAVQFVVANLTWDIEEDLSRLVGDVPAHRLVAAGEAFVRWQRDTATRLADNVREYLTQESGTLASPAAMRTFTADVREARDGVERLEKRIALLESRMKASE